MQPIHDGPMSVVRRLVGRPTGVEDKIVESDAVGGDEERRGD